MKPIERQSNFKINNIGTKESVIYIIKNILNNKIYIGQTTNYWRRAKSHRRQLERNIHKNVHLQNTFNLNNGCLLMDILEICCKEELNNREIHWIKYYNSNNENYGYNKTLGGSNPDRKYPTREEYLINCSNKFKKMINEGIIDKRIPILCYTIKDEKFYKEYFSIKEAADDLKLDKKTIREVLSNKFSQTRGYTFIKKMNNNIPERVEFSPGKKMRARLALKIDLNNNLIVERFTTLADLVPVFGYHVASIRRIFRKNGFIIKDNYKYIYP